MKVLIIEDDREITDVIRITLEMRWPDAKVFTTHLGHEGVSLAESESPDIIILDLGLPDTNGYDVLKKIRAFSDVSVLILTARGEEADITRGLEWGADDYVVKPFRQMELLARIQALLRRASRTFTETVLSRGSLRFNPTTRQLNIGAKELNLTRTEGVILEELMENAGRVVTHNSLAEAVWGSDYPSSVESLRVYIRRLREKIEEDPDNPQYILTRAGVGYSFKD